MTTDNSYRPYLMKEVLSDPPPAAPVVITTFAGGGGSCIGYHLAGMRVALANEFVPEARRTYGCNFPNVPIDGRDIREIIRDDAAIGHFLAKAGICIGGFDILNGSPPCCEFSTAKKGMVFDQTQRRAYSDVEQSGMATLMFDYFRLAKMARPKVVIAENIPALASRHRHIFDGALDELRFSGKPRTREYYAGAAVLSAADFGVAQDRRRLFIIGVRADVAETIGITSDDAILTVFPEPHGSPVTVRAALAGLKQTAREIYSWRRAMHVSALGKVIAQFPHNPGKWTRPQHVGLDPHSRFSLVRCAWDLPAPTLTVSGQRPDGMSGAIHPDQDRKFTIAELKRLFGLADDYVATGTLGQAAERICRMVPPLLMKAIAHAVHERVLRPYAESRR